MSAPIPDEVTIYEAGEEAASINETMRTAVFARRGKAVQDLFGPITPSINEVAALPSHMKQASIAANSDDRLIYDTSSQSALHSIPDEKYATWRSGSMGKLLEDNIKEGSPTEEKEQKRRRGAGSVDEAIVKLSALSTIIDQVATTLSRRFQRKGWAHFKHLGHLVNGSHRDDALKRYEDKIKIKNKNTATSGCDDDVILPAAVYKVRAIRMHCLSLCSI